MSNKPQLLGVGVTILCSGDGVELSFECKNSRAQFLTVSMSPENFAAALGRLACVPASATVRGLDRVGKVHQHKTLEFEVIDDYMDCKEDAIARVHEVCPEGWFPDTYFGSQSSFFEEDGKRFARTTIRRWLDPGDPRLEEENV